MSDLFQGGLPGDYIAMMAKVMVQASWHVLHLPAAASRTSQSYGGIDPQGRMRAAYVVPDGFRTSGFYAGTGCKANSRPLVRRTHVR